jgi:hypothetical protein
MEFYPTAGGLRIECLDVVLGVDEVYRGLELLDAE